MHTLKKILISEVVNGVLSQRQLVGKQAVDVQLIEAMAKLHHLRDPSMCLCVSVLPTTLVVLNPNKVL